MSEASDPLGGWVRGTTVRREALATIRAVGGRVVFRDEQPTAGGFWVELYRRTGLDLAREISVVVVDGPPAAGATTAPRPTRDEACAAIGQLGRVEIVDVNAGWVTPANLADLAKARAKNIGLMGVDEVSAELLTELRRMRHLTGLRINHPQAGANAATIQAIGSIPQLELLDLYGFASLRSDDLIPLGQLTRLRRLSMIQAPVDDSFLDHWQALNHVTTLELPTTQISDARLRALADRSPDLAIVQFDGSTLTDAGVAALAKCSHLGSVEFLGQSSEAHGLTDASLVTMGRHRWLMSLRMTTGRFTEAGLDALANLPLNSLDVGSVESISELGMRRLLTSQPFDRLGLAGPAITDDLLPLLIGHLNPGGCLDSVPIGDHRRRDASPRRAASGRLNLSHTALSDAGLATLTTGTTIRELIARNTKITPAGAAAFRAARPGTRLDLDPTPEGN